MKEINWKSLSLSLIISTILNGTVLSILLIQYINTISYLFHEILSHINNSINNSKVSVTIAYGKPPIPFWAEILIFSMSYIFVTMISYLLIELLNRRKKQIYESPFLNNHVIFILQMKKCKLVKKKVQEKGFELLDSSHK